MDHLTRHQRREAARRRTRRQRRRAALVLLALGVVGVVAVAGGAGGGDEPAGGGGDRAARRPPKPPELPRGGRRIFPDHRVVGFYGAPQADALGVLGIGPVDRVAAKLEKQARPYRRGGRPVLPAYELIATIAAGGPGEDGLYRTRQKEGVIRRYHRAARRAKALFVLDVQPGRADFMDEVRAYREFLEQPDVSLALDPEWSMGPGEVPGRTIGSTTAAKVNEVSAYLADIVRRRNLPQKLLIVHQFTDDMIENRPALRRRPGVALTLNVDGFGDRAVKAAKYREFTRARGARRFPHGFKLFYEEDTNLMRPRDVLRLRPRPDLVMYE